MKIAYAGVTLTLMLSATYLALREPSGTPAVASTVEAASTNVPTPARESPATAISTQEPTSPSAEASMPRYRRRSLQTTPLGSVRVVRSADYIRSFEIRSLGSKVKENDYSTVAVMAKARYGVNDEELASLLDYSVKAVEADRAYEIVQTRKMCDRRAEFQSLHDLGMALNYLTKDIESNQERLSRGAEAVLGPMIVAKVNAVLLSSQHHYDNAFTTDWPVLLAARNADLSTELEQVCGWLERPGADEEGN